MSAEHPKKYAVVRRGKELHLQPDVQGIACWPQAEVGRRLGLHKSRIGQLIREGKLSTIEVRGRRYVTDSSVRLYEEGALARQMLGAKTRRFRV